MRLIKRFFYPYLGILLGMVLCLTLNGCFSKKGKLIPFESLSSYYPYPQDLEKFRLYLSEGQPDYVIFQGDEEQWVYVCKDKIYKFEPISTEGKQPTRVVSQNLNSTKVEAKLPEEDRERLGKCRNQKPAIKEEEEGREEEEGS